MSNLNSSDWVIFVIVVVGMAGYTYLLGQHFSEAAGRWLFLGRHLVYQKWGVDRDVFWPNSRLQFIGLGILIGLGTGVMVGLAHFNDSPKAVAGEVGIGLYDLLVSVGSYGFIIGAVLKAQTVFRAHRQVEDLEGLGEVFHQRFARSELLSMYEALRLAPRLFWEEYSKLSEHEISEQSNNKYRMRAAPYLHKQSSRYSRLGISVATIALALSGLLWLIDLFR